MIITRTSKAYKKYLCVCSNFCQLKSLSKSVRLYRVNKKCTAKPTEGDLCNTRKNILWTCAFWSMVSKLRPPTSINDSYVPYLYSLPSKRTYIPIAWRQVKVMFIPKPWKANYTKAKAHSPISLSPFTLKMMEKLVDRHIRDGILWLCPLHQYQSA